MSEAAQKKFRKFVRELGRLIRAEPDKGLAVRRPKTKAKTTTKPRAKVLEWISACLDVRWFSEGGGFTAKLRVVLPNGCLHSIQLS